MRWRRPQVLIRRKADGTWQGIMKFRSGRVWLCTCRESDMAAEIVRRVEAELGPGASSGGLWSSIKKIARKIARARVLKKVAAAYKAVARNPIVAKAVGLTGQAFGIPPSVSQGILRGTTKASPGALAAAALLPGGMVNLGIYHAVKDSVRTPKGRKALAGTIAAAAAGNPRARAVVNAIGQASRAVRAIPSAEARLVAAAQAGNPRAVQLMSWAAQSLATLTPGASSGARAFPWSGNASVNWQIGAVGRPRISIVCRRSY